MRSDPTPLDQSGTAVPGNKKNKQAKMAAPTSSSGEIYHQLKSAKKAKKHCYVHLASVKKEDVQDCTRTRWETFINSAKRWLRLPAVGESHAIAQAYERCIERTLKIFLKMPGFHATCYRRFIDKKRLDAAEKRTTQCTEDQAAGESGASSASTSECPRKKT